MRLSASANWFGLRRAGLVLMEAVKRLYATTARSEGRVLLAKAPMRKRPETKGALPENNRDS
jgi:hypothetical protein